MVDLYRFTPTTLDEETGLLSLGNMCVLCSDKWSATEYLYGERVLSFVVRCPVCESAVGYKRDPWLTKYNKNVLSAGKGPADFTDCFKYRCKNRTCNWQEAVFKNSFFADCKILPNKILMGLHLWLGGGDPKMIGALTGLGKKRYYLTCAVIGSW